MQEIYLEEQRLSVSYLLGVQEDFTILITTISGSQGISIGEIVQTLFAGIKRAVLNIKLKKDQQLVYQQLNINLAHLDSGIRKY